MAFSEEEIERYARHIVLPGVGGPGQQKLKSAQVLVIGAGGLGAPVLQYLAAVGVGTLGVIDDDVVSLSNLQRQVIHGTDDVGRAKVDSAADALYAVNPNVAIVKHLARFNADNAVELASHYDLVIDGSDNFATRYLSNDACYFARKPLLSGAVGQYDGFMTMIRASDQQNGVPNPNYRCLFPKPPADGQAPACEEAGVLGALTGVIGSMMAFEAIKAITGFGDELVGKLFIYDGRDCRTQVITYSWDQANALTGENATITQDNLGETP